MGAINGKWKEEQIQQTGRKRWPSQHSVASYSWPYYARMGLLFFCVGSGMELFMIMSGFYKFKMDTVEDIDKALTRHYEQAWFSDALKAETEKKLREMGKINDTEKSE